MRSAATSTVARRWKPKLDADGKVVLDGEGEPVLVPVYVASPGLEKSEKFEPVEVRAVSEYLLDVSQPFEYIDKQQGVTEEASAERGKEVFQVRGCLACHQHKDFPDAKDTQGPDLSRIGDKLTSPDAAKWLYSWVREPKHYHCPHRDAELVPRADHRRRRQGFGSGGRRHGVPVVVTRWLESGRPPTVVEKDLDDLAAEYLRGSFTNRQTEDYLKNGIPAKLRDQLKVDEQLLVATDGMTPEENTRHKLLYVGRRTIGRLGCAGCHDIPGFEDAKADRHGLGRLGSQGTVEAGLRAGRAVHRAREFRAWPRPRAQHRASSRSAQRRSGLGLLPGNGASITSAKASSGKNSASRAATTTG